jgi:hypothetical protein
MKKTTEPFRVTIILGDESPVAQIEQIERIVDDGGEIIASKILPAETLEMPISEEIIGALNASLLAQVEPLTKERDDLTAQVEALTAQVESLTKAQEVIELAPVEPQSIPTYGVSKLSIMRRLGDKWPTLKAALATLPETVQDSWTLALEISANDPLFVEFRPQLMSILEMADEEFDALLTF